MKLSEAVLLGLPEIHFTNNLWFDRSAKVNGKCSGCLVGAALYAIGSRSSNNRAVFRVWATWPWTRRYRWSGTNCPICRDGAWADGLGSALTHLAEHYKDEEVSAEAIADYIHSIEPAEEEAPAAAAEQGRGVLVAK